MKQGILHEQNAFLSVTVTLIYSVAYMKTLLGGIGLVRQAALYGIWTGVILLLKTVFPMAYHYILYQLPLLVHVAIWCLAIVALGKDLSRFIHWNCKYNFILAFPQNINRVRARPQQFRTLTVF